MRRTHFFARCALPLALACWLAAGPALADKPRWAGEKGNASAQRAEHSRATDEDRGANRRIATPSHFDDRHRRAVREYYADRLESGSCPPGLAKKRNGCMPPGQARKWALGRPLPRDVIFYDVPRSLSVQLGPPPSGYRYVRVAGDILMIAIGTGLVVDAIRDLGN